MKIRWLALLLLLALAGGLPARGEGPSSSPAARPSHKPINDGLADDRNPEDRLRSRLMQSQLKEKEQQQFASQIQQMARELLKDEKFVESLKKNLTPDQIDRLKQKYAGQGGGVRLDDPALRKLLDQGLKGSKIKVEDPKLKEHLKKLGVTGQPGTTDPSNPPGTGPTPMPPTSPITPPPMPSTTPPPSPSRPPGDSSNWDDLAKETPDWMKKGLDRAAGDLGKWLDTPSGKSWRGSVMDMARKMAEARSSAPALSPRLRAVNRYLPRVRDWLPQRSPSLPSARLPALPRLTGSLPGVSSMSGVSAQGTGKALVVVVALVVLALLLWYSRGWWQEVLAARLAGWKLGPWPIRPGEVTTRGDLVRAFEYLALLCLGPAARTCHHLELARRIGAQPALDTERRRDAAEDLARVYEQARYTPDDERLPDELLARARRELGYLAGEPVA